MTALAALALAMTAATPVPVREAAAQDPVDALHADILAGPTATAALQRRCGDAPVAVSVDRAAHVPASAGQRARLRVDGDEPVGYRRVRLTCGDRVLSLAENWFVPARLSAEMNAALAAGERPYGAVVAPLNPWRTNLAAERLWDGQGPAPEAVLRHRALVFARDGTPLAEVVETYQRGALRTAE